MSPKTLKQGLCVVAFWLCAVVLASVPARAAESGCVTEKCHPSILKKSNEHAVGDTCDSCHEVVEAEHPQKGKKTFKLAKEEPDLCYDCHDAMGQKKSVHSPVEQGMCTSCHNPHASDNEKLLTDPPKELCKGCHEDQTTFEYMHGPASTGDCVECHAVHEADEEHLLLKPERDLCLGCHDEMEGIDQKQFVHSALDSGCTACHNPHGSAHKKLLAADGQAVCFDCHDSIADTVKAATSPHKPVGSEKGCASCHTPHASDNESLLLEPQKALCVSCHEKILTKDMKVLHGPIEKGECVGCHNPHGSTNRKILEKEFPPDAYVPYTGTEYALCFSSCHKRELMQYEETSFATKFRDGERNLHYVHVNKTEKGRSCRFCHEIHGGPNPKLIAESVPFGQWQLPLNYVKTETGGGCTPGCHKAQVYNRDVPGRKPAATKATAKGG